VLPEPQADAVRGVWTLDVVSSLLGGTNRVEVLLPDRLDKNERHPTLYLLPVEPAQGRAFGDGMQLARRLDVHNRHGLVVVAPSFDTMPWYGNHANDPGIRHEDYLVRELVPLIERHWPTGGTPERRLLLGFSKSGWGAWTLIARHPAVFGYAASWDAPLAMDAGSFGEFETAQHFGTREQYVQYLPTELLQSNAAPFQQKTRLVLAGESLFGKVASPLARRADPAYSHTREMHERLLKYGVKHTYIPELASRHAWNETWMEPTLDALMALTVTR
jgi:S-formylglutathione hydrolase FrmB